MQTNQYTQLAEKRDFNGFNGSVLSSVSVAEDPHFKSMIHRRTEEIDTKIRLIETGLTSAKELQALRYIINNTKGRGKPTDQIAISQFMNGKRCKKTGRVLDFGCGLKSPRPIRQARKSLIEKGIIFEEEVTDLYGARQANRYGLVFLRDLLEDHNSQEKVKSLEKHTPTPYHKKHPTIDTSYISKQRCITTRNLKKPTKPFMDSQHVDFLIDLIEQGTGDSHSRGAFAETALTVSEGKIMELLSMLKDRGDIRNKGAWFLSVARKYQQRRIIKADASEPPEKREEREQPIPPTISFTEKLLSVKPKLAQFLDMNKKLQQPAIHHKLIVGK
jgi:hypothetical protein